MPKCGTKKSTSKGARDMQKGKGKKEEMKDSKKKIAKVKKGGKK